MNTDELRNASDPELIERVIDPLMQAGIEDRRFFDDLAEPSRTVVTLWTLTVQVMRNGLAYFIEDERAWLVRGVAGSARAFGDERLAELFEQLEPNLRAGRPGRLRAPRSDVMEAIGAPIAAHIGDRSDLGTLDARLLEYARAHLDVLVADAVRATAHVERRALSKAKKAENAAVARRAEWDRLRADGKPWSMKERFSAGDVLLHPKLGAGRVAREVGDDKIEVEFEDGSTRTLVHGRG